MKAVPSFSMTREGETFDMLGDREDVKARLVKAWDIRFDGRKDEGHGSGETVSVAAYTRNDSAMAGRVDDHFAEVFKALHKETADCIRVVDSATGAAIQYGKGYIQVAYDIWVLGKYSKAAPEVEDLLAQTN